MSMEFRTMSYRAISLPSFSSLALQLLCCGLLLGLLPGTAWAGPLAPVPKRQAKSTHAPYGMGMCKSCHKGGSKKRPGKLKGPIHKVCYKCHNEMQATVTKTRFKHAPVQSGCSTCHNPHNSKYEHLLRQPGTTLCTSCHTSIKDALKSKVKHGPMTSSRSCGSCHDPHGSKIQKLLLDNTYALCVRCHGKKNMKDDTGKKMVNIRAELKKNKRHHGPVKFKDCSACHQPHGSKNFRLLNEQYPSRFYVRYNKKHYELCFQCHSEDNIEKQVSKATGFRDGTRNLHYVHVVKPRMGRTCRACHEVHASPQSFHIRTSVPYGNSGWRLEINFKKSATGGTCVKTCHGAKTYSRKK